jgi:hypothetical protein
MVKVEVSQIVSSGPAFAIAWRLMLRIIEALILGHGELAVTFNVKVT